MAKPKTPLSKRIIKRNIKNQLSGKKTLRGPAKYARDAADRKIVKRKLPLTKAEKAKAEAAKSSKRKLSDDHKAKISDSLKKHHAGKRKKAGLFGKIKRFVKKKLRDHKSKKFLAERRQRVAAVESNKRRMQTIAKQIKMLRDQMDGKNKIQRGIITSRIAKLRDQMRDLADENHKIANKYKGKK